MANNFQQTAFVFKTGTPEQSKMIVGWLKGKDLPAELVKEFIDHDPDWDEYTICTYAEVTNDGHLYVGVNDGDFEMLVIALDQAMQRWPDVPTPQGFEWASWCDKLRTSEFSGGAVALTRGSDPSFFSTSQWLRQQGCVST